MKLRNLMYATMIACAFASCSKDDVTTPGAGDDAEANAVLDIQFESNTTKALPGSVNEEDAINTLSLLVFNGTSDNAVLEVIGTDAGESTGNSVKAAVKPGNKTVIVLANVDLTKSSPAITAGSTTYANLKAATLAFANGEKEGGLTMNSKAYQVTVVASKTNYMGYGAKDDTDDKAYLEANIIKLYRNVAKINLTSVVLGTPNANQYPDASIVLKEVLVLHAHANTNLVGSGAAEWGAINVKGSYLNGVVNATYQNPWVVFMTGKTPVYPYIPTPVEGATVPYNQETSYALNLSGGSYNSTTEGAEKKIFYVYENTEAIAVPGTEYATLLVVKADFKYKNVNGGDETLSDRYYPIAVGYGKADFAKVPASLSGLRTGSLSGVIRNLQYNVALTISGPGYETPFGPKPDGGEGSGDTFLDAAVQVVAFGQVDQSETIE